MGHSIEPNPSYEGGEPNKCVRRERVKRDISRLYFVFQATDHILTGGNCMNGKRIQLLLTGVTACISLLCLITTTYGATS